jgi:hypothetical protein
MRFINAKGANGREKREDLGLFASFALFAPFAFQHD